MASGEADPAMEDHPVAPPPEEDRGTPAPAPAPAPPPRLPSVTPLKKKKRPDNPSGAGAGAGAAAGAAGAAAGAADKKRPTKKPKPKKQPQQQQQQDELEERVDDVVSEEEEHETDHSKTYNEYRAIRGTGCVSHPVALVESMSLASVDLPEATYEHHLGADVRAHRLSDAQLESVIYANQRFAVRLETGERAGFFLGDGAGVGKGRQIAAIVKNFVLFQKSQGLPYRVLWLSVSSDLALDARRDLADLKCGPNIAAMHPDGTDKLPPGPISAVIQNGIVFTTYSLLINPGGKGGAAQGGGGGAHGRGPAAAATSGRKRSKAEANKAARDVLSVNLLSKPGSRFTQILTWLRGGDEADGRNCLLILDECHQAKSILEAKPSKTGVAVYVLQAQLPSARVVYSSATGATEVRNMAYMTRLGTWGFRSMDELVLTLHKSGLGAVEMFAMGLKATGSYLSRALSFKDAEFRTEVVDIDPEFRVLYDRAAQMWTFLLSVLRLLPATDDDGGPDTRGATFWGAHQRFFKMILMAAKVRRCVELCQKALADGMCCVVGLQMTGEACMNQTRKANGDDAEVESDVLSAPRMILSNVVSKVFFKDAEEMEDLMSPAEARELALLAKRIYLTALAREPCNQRAAEIGEGPRRPEGLAAADRPEAEVELLIAEAEVGRARVDLDAKREKARQALEAAGGGGASVPSCDCDVCASGRLALSGGHASPFLLPAPVYYLVGSDPLTPEQTHELAAQEEQRLAHAQEAQARWLATAGPPAKKRPAATKKNPAAAKKKKKSAAASSSSSSSDSSDSDSSDSGSSSSSSSDSSDGEQRPGRTLGDAVVAANREVELAMETLRAKEAALGRATAGPASGGRGRSGVGGVLEAQRYLLEAIRVMEMPPNPLDQMLEALGGEGKVAEMTGRKGRMARGASGKFAYTKRRADARQKDINLEERDDFMAGRKLVAIISDAASTGISLHADRRARNQRRRFHITLELPWSADSAIQQFGRSHRSNQASAPVYCMLVSRCGGEYRFAGAVAKRLATLGAVLQGDQKAMGAAANLKAYDVDTEIARKALARCYEDVTSRGKPMVGVRVPSLPAAYLPTEAETETEAEAEDGEEAEASAFHAMATRCLLDVELATVSAEDPSEVVVDEDVLHDVRRFLNRILGLPLFEQDLLFEYFAATLAASVKKAKSEGRHMWTGVEVLRGTAHVLEERVIHTDRVTKAVTKYVRLRGDRGFSWRDALEQRDRGIAAAAAAAAAAGAHPPAPPSRARSAPSAFWQSAVLSPGHQRPYVLLASEVVKEYVDDRATLVRIQRPNDVEGTTWTLTDLRDRYRRLSDDAAACELWTFWYDRLEKGCIHGPECTARNERGWCGVGCREFVKHLLCGAMLPVLKTMFETLETSPHGRIKPARPGERGYKPPPRALRCDVDDGRALVGMSLLLEDWRLFENRLMREAAGMNGV